MIKVNGEIVQLQEPVDTDIFEIEGTGAAEYRWTEADQSDPAGRWRARAASDQLVFSRALTAAWATATDFITLDGAGLTVTFGVPLLISSGADPALHVTHTEDDAAVQVAILEGDRATVAASDEAFVSMRLSDDAGDQKEFARLTWIGVDVTAGSEDGAIALDVMVAGTVTRIANFQSNSSGVKSTHLNSSLVIGSADQALTAITGETFRAGDLTTGGAGNLAGADLTIRPGLGTGTGDVGQLILQAVRVAAAGDNIHTVNTAVVLDDDGTNPFLNLSSITQILNVAGSGNDWTDGSLTVGTGTSQLNAQGTDTTLSMLHGAQVRLSNNSSGATSHVGTYLRDGAFALDDAAGASWIGWHFDNSTITYNGDTTVTTRQAMIQVARPAITFGTGTAKTINDFAIIELTPARPNTSITFDDDVGLYIHTVGAITGTINTQHGIQIETLGSATNNFAITIGSSDADQNLIHVGATGDPVLMWDESDEAFAFAWGSTAVNTLRIENTTADTGAHALLELKVSGTTGGDAQIRWTTPSGYSYYMGVDNNNGDQLIIGRGTTIGSTSSLTVNNDGKMALGADINVNNKNFTEIGDFTFNAGAVISFDSGDVVLTHSAGALSLTGDGAVALGLTATVTVTGNVIPEADGTRDLGVQTTAQWANLWADLVNGSDYAYLNGWRSLESEKYDGYPAGFAIGHTGFEVGTVTDRMDAREKPVFAVTDEWIEYKGRRITAEMLDRVLELAAA